MNEPLRRSPEDSGTLPPRQVGDDTLPPIAPASDGTCVQSGDEVAETVRRSVGPAVDLPGYEVLGELGRGGMGVVYKARHLRLGRLVALKMVLHAEHAQQEELLRFLSEAEAVAQLQHPNIVQLFDSGQHRGVPYFTLELVEGGTLADKLRQNPLTPPEAARLIEQTARGVQHAHERGILHRDLKPANVLLARDGTPRVADFGLAKRVDVGTALTATGNVMGTPSYMAPEQAGGQGKRVGPAADVYALGAILYECLTGRPPFRAATAIDTLLQVLSDEPVPVRTLAQKCPRDLETICHKCLQKEPGKRYASAEALADDLRRFENGEPIRARPVGWIERAVKWARRRPAAAALMAVAVLLVIGSVFGGVLYNRQLHETRAVARAQSLVAALRTADTPAVGRIVDELAEVRERVAPVLRAILDDPDATPREKLHAALALLPGDDAQVGYLKERLLAARPDEVNAIREALRPHSGGVAEELWPVLLDGKADGGRRLRAACALALYAPEDERWKDAAPVVAGRLVTESPLLVGPFVEALRPARSALVGSLTAVFHDPKRPEAEHRLATSLLADYAADRPEVLTALLEKADAWQYGVLFPVVQKHRDRAVADFNAVLARQATPDWKDAALDSSWIAIDPDALRRIEAAEGMVAERFALCQALPLADLDGVTAALRRAGYRPERLRPYAAGGGVQVGAVWTRDGLDHRTIHGVTAEEVRRLDTQHRKQGYRPVDVAGYLASGGRQPPEEDRYAAVWVKATDGVETELYVGVPDDRDFADAWQALRDRAFIIHTHQVFRAGDGKGRHSAVWRKTEPAEWSDLSALTRADFDTKVAENNATVDVNVLPATPPDWRATALAALTQADADLLKDAKNVNALFRRGQAAFRLGRDAQAMADFEGFLAGGAQGNLSYRYRAILLARLGRAAEARRDAADFAKRSTDASRVASLEAMVTAWLGEDEDGLEQLERALKEHAGDPQWLYNAGCAYAVAAAAASGSPGRTARAVAGLTFAAPETGLWNAAALAWGESISRQRGVERATRHADRAIDLLGLSLAAGQQNSALLETDADLDAIRSHPGFRGLFIQAKLDRRYGGVWHAATDREGTVLVGLEPAEHRKRCGELAAAGWRPVAMSVAEPAAGQPRVAVSAWQRPVLAEREVDALAVRQANVAVALLRLNETDPVWPLLRHTATPSRRSHLLARMEPLGVDPQVLVDRLDSEQDVSARRALIVALGEFGNDRLPAAAREQLVPRLLEWYRDNPDPGIHGAIDWLLRHGKEGLANRAADWGQRAALEKIDGQLKGQQPQGGRNWYVNSQGQTLAVIPRPGEFWMGSPASELERFDTELRHRRRIDRNFAIGTKEVTVRQFEVFKKANPQVFQGFTKRYSPDLDGPIVTVTWYDAAQYCRWLSEQEGIAEEEMVYPSVAEIEKAKRGLPLKLPADHLSRTGYRLPTEAEWEYACRAGSEEARYYGGTVELLLRHAWFLLNSDVRAWPVGQKRPNDFGLFDMLGNALEWTQEGYRPYQPGAGGKAIADIEDKRDIVDPLSRVLRGGSFNYLAPYVRGAFRFINRPSDRDSTVGVRVARTFR